MNIPSRDNADAITQNPLNNILIEIKDNLTKRKKALNSFENNHNSTFKELSEHLKKLEIKINNASNCNLLIENNFKDLISKMSLDELSTFLKIMNKLTYVPSSDMTPIIDISQTNKWYELAVLIYWNLDHSNGMIIPNHTNWSRLIKEFVTKDFQSAISSMDLDKKINYLEYIKPFKEYFTNQYESYLYIMGEETDLNSFLEYISINNINSILEDVLTKVPFKNITLQYEFLNKIFREFLLNIYEIDKTKHETLLKNDYVYTIYNELNHNIKERYNAFYELNKNGFLESEYSLKLANKLVLDIPFDFSNIKANSITIRNNIQKMNIKEFSQLIDEYLVFLQMQPHIEKTSSNNNQNFKYQKCFEIDFHKNSINLNFQNLCHLIKTIDTYEKVEFCENDIYYNLIISLTKMYQNYYKLNGSSKDFEKLSYHDFLESLFKKLPYNSIHAKALVFDEYFCEYYKWLQDAKNIVLEVPETNVTNKKKTLLNKIKRPTI